MVKKILTIAGSDSGAGAGIQADLKTISALGGYATTAITAVTAQNTHGVQEIHPIPPEIVGKQISAVLEDIGADCMKTGMLCSSEIIEEVARILQEHPNIPLIIDPVLKASDGSNLTEGNFLDSLKSNLLPITYLLTPNTKEAEIIAGVTSINNINDMRNAATKILKFGCQAVLIKGGHLPDLQTEVTDFLLTKDGTEEIFSHKLIKSSNLHGTGCTLASAIATYVAQGLPLQKAITCARKYLYNTIISCQNDIGTGNGPLNHLIRLDICNK